jgi:hypothetical protein
MRRAGKTAFPDGPMNPRIMVVDGPSDSIGASPPQRRLQREECVAPWRGERKEETP